MGKQGSHLRFGDFRLDPVATELFHGARRVAIQEKALRVLEALLERPGQAIRREELSKALASPLDLAASYAVVGETDRALDLLDRAFEEREPMLLFVGRYGPFESVWDDPRLEAMWRRSELPGGPRLPTLASAGR